MHRGSMGGRSACCSQETRDEIESIQSGAMDWGKIIAARSVVISLFAGYSVTGVAMYTYQCVHSYTHKSSKWVR
jgi:hypothetical protein